MPERIDAIVRMLEEQRDGQAKANELLAQVRVAVAGMTRSFEAQQEGIFELRRQQGETSERLRSVELALATLPMHEKDLARLFGRHSDLELRVRTLEGDGRETKVVHGAVKIGARDIFKHIVSVIAGAVTAAVIFAATKGV